MNNEAIGRIIIEDCGVKIDKQAIKNNDFIVVNKDDNGQLTVKLSKELSEFLDNKLF